eukprot:COSAG02_NODE_7177_length_3136_cov_143.220283_3_plen_143_part_00
MVFLRASFLPLSVRLPLCSQRQALAARGAGVASTGPCTCEGFADSRPTLDSTVSAHGLETNHFVSSLIAKRCTGPARMTFSKMAVDQSIMAPTFIPLFTSLLYCLEGRPQVRTRHNCITASPVLSQRLGAACVRCVCLSLWV